MSRFKMDLTETHPELCANEWDHEKNLTLDIPLIPEDVTAGSHELVWWKCPKACSEGCAHSYLREVCKKISNGKTKKSTGCPFPGCCKPPQDFCKHESLLFKNPELAEEWDHEKNLNELGLTINKILPHSDKVVYWICREICICGGKHEWTASPKTRSRGSDCPFCSCIGNKYEPHCNQTSLVGKYPELIKEWSDKNDRDPNSYHPNSHEKVWWECNKTKCGCSHFWQSTIANRTTGENGCPYCAEYQATICYHNSLEYLRPDLMKKWNYVENIKFGLDPRKISTTPNKKAYWICPNNHTYFSDIKGRTRKLKPSECPHCKHKTETKLFEWLNIKYPNEITSQTRFKWCKSPREGSNVLLPFDFIINKFKLIIELDGPQHFRQISNWQSPEKARELDKHKMGRANENGYTVIRLLQEEVLNDLNDWEIKLEEAVKEYDSPKKIYISGGNEYDAYQ